MNSIEETEPALVRKSSVFSSLLILVGFVLLGLFVGQFIAFLGMLPLFNYDFQSIAQALANPADSPHAKASFLILQAAGSLFGFILAPLLHQRVIDHTRTTPLTTQYETSAIILGIVFILMIAFMFANSAIIEWNMNLDLGKLSPSFEEWAKGKEDELKELTEFLTRFDSIGGLLVGLIVIAVLPAIGEELLFRGLVQPKLQKLTGNPHAAIWIAALLFSAIHFQFYGFFPRLLLGALFGYLFYWSGNLWYAIFAHFINNGFTLIMLYLYQQDVTDIDMEATEAVSWPVVLLAFVAGGFLLFQFHQLTKNRQLYG